MRRILLLYSTAVALPLILAAPTWAQQAPLPTPPASPDTSPAPEAGIHPDAVSSFQVRTYRISPKKLFKGLLEVLGQAGYPPEEVDEKGRKVKTSFVDFNSRDYSEAVADPAPRLSPTYQILQMNIVKLGKVSLEGIVGKGDDGDAVLSLRARLLVDGLQQPARVRILTDRRSSGVIESDFMRRLEDTLGLVRK
ncbi:MAG TPA: hypothetical protein VJV75_05445 [Candidatus Polarisedimenticolia bacterium]|nr:hypothetical protein [Candidatus Polarisedimenticolia bacterium]